jgi:hypothetical protein
MIIVKTVKELKKAVNEDKQTAVRLSFTDEIKNDDILNDNEMQELAIFIGTNPPLEILVISDNDIQMLGVTYIAEAMLHNTNLKQLSLARNNIDNYVGVPSSLAFEAIAKMLRENKSLEILNLNLNDLSGDKNYSIAMALAYNNTLNSIGLNCCSIDDYHLWHLKNSLAVNGVLKLLDISDNEITKGQHIADIIRQNKLLKVMRISGNSPIQNVDSIISAIKTTDNLVELGIVWCGLAIEDVALISRLVKVNSKSSNNEQFEILNTILSRSAKANGVSNWSDEATAYVQGFANKFAIQQARTACRFAAESQIQDIHR